MARSADNVIYGEALAYRMPYVGDGSEDFPDIDTIGYGDEWGGTFVEFGYTQDGITVSITHEYEDIDVDQELDSLFTVLTGREVNVETTLAEFTPENLAVSAGQGATSTTAPGVGTHGYTEYEITAPNAPTFYSVGLDILHPATGLPARWMFWKALPTSDMEAVFGNRAENAQIPVRFRVLPDTGGGSTRLLAFREHTAPTS